MMSQLCKIRDVQRAIVQYETAFEKLHGISLNEGMVLCSLLHAPSLTSGELMALLGLSQSNTSKVIASVEKKKSIRRALGKDDKRQMYFHITDKGRQCLEHVRGDEIEIPEVLMKAIE
jgi:DNA-binding MarR family transcriptional regulator